MLPTFYEEERLDSRHTVSFFLGRGIVNVCMNRRAVERQAAAEAESECANAEQVECERVVAERVLAEAAQAELELDWFILDSPSHSVSLSLSLGLANILRAT